MTDPSLNPIRDLWLELVGLPAREKADHSNGTRQGSARYLALVEAIRAAVDARRVIVGEEEWQLIGEDLDAEQLLTRKYHAAARARMKTVSTPITPISPISPLTPTPPVSTPFSRTGPRQYFRMAKAAVRTRPLTHATRARSMSGTLEHAIARHQHWLDRRSLTPEKV